MSRTKGSKNLPKGNIGLSTIKLEKQIENAPIIRPNSMGWILFGQKNLYPFDLINLYNTSVTHRACVDFATNAIVGDGIDTDKMLVNNEDLQAPNYHTSWNEFVRALAFDLVMYNAFSFQVIKNKDNKTYSFFHQPIETIRLEEVDEDGVINGAYICQDWSATGKYPPIRLPMFGMQEEESIPMGQPYLFYHRVYNCINAYYGIPTYSAGINAILAEAQFQQYDLRSVLNGFSSVGAITLPQVETDAERQAIIDNIQALFTGSQNANSVAICFRNNVEDKPIEFTPFTQSLTNVNLYADSNERTVNRILAAHKIPSKALIGYPADNTGFSDSGAYLESAFALYNVNVANQNRREIVDVVNNLFKLNGVDVELALKPLKYRVDQDTVDESQRSVGTPQTEEEVTEQVSNKEEQ